ncbi:MAG: carboxypeptidase-like regulatory domain-containing protein, partial [Alistipes sp.]|nr:carboxypeptidase-like regulatory domain-containing protein [Alistipes sp.]
MKKFLTTILFTCLVVASYAQSGKVTMSVIDSQSKQAVIGAVVSIAPAAKLDDAKHFTTGDNGKVVIPAQKYGDYKLTITFLGYDDLEMDLKINSANKDLGKVALTESTTKIDAVVKEVQAIRASQKGDTVSYNAGAFKVASDADVEGLLKKMPGITIKNGSVEAQGETVKKIYVDGKEFFGDDVATALNSLPAQAVKNIEVYNKLSDNAEFSGMDDGDSFKALNIVTQPGMRQGVFGKLFGAYGYEPKADGITDKHKYLAGGSVSHFNGASRLTLLGLFNNVNKQNFSFEDIVGATGSTGGHGGGMGRGGVGQYMVRPQSGIAKVNAIGLNYSNSWGEKDKVKLQANYFYNDSKTRNLSQTIKWYEAPLADLGTLEQESYNDNHNYNHRFGARVDWRISEGQSFMSRTNFSLQSYDPFSETYGTQKGDAINNLIKNGSTGDNGGYNLSEFIQYRLLLGKKGRFITVDGRVNYRNNENDSRSYSNQATDGSEYLRYLSNDAGSNNLGVGAAINYAEPVSEFSQVVLRYDFNYTGQESVRNTFNFGNDASY